MQEVMKESVKLVNRTTQTLLLKELVRRKIPLKDVSSIEMKQRWNGRGKKDVQMIDFLMRRKLRSAVWSAQRGYQGSGYCRGSLVRSPDCCTAGNHPGIAPATFHLSQGYQRGYSR